MENRPLARNAGGVLLDRQQANADAIFLDDDYRSDEEATHWLISSRSSSG